MKTKLLLLFTILLFPLTGSAIDNTPQDASARTITAGGTSQTVFAANPNRRWLLIQNQSDEAMYLNFGAAAAAGTTSIKLDAGGAYECPANYCPTTTVTIVSATTGKAFFAKQGGF